MSAPRELVWCEFHTPRGRRVTDADAHAETDECVWPMLSGIYATGERVIAAGPSMTAAETLDPREAVRR